MFIMIIKILMVIAIVSEIVSLMCATYLFFFSDVKDLISKDRYYSQDEADFILFFIAFLLGWCSMPVFVYMVYLNFKERNKKKMI